MGRHFVMCWELGADLGHVSQMATIAAALRDRGQRVSVVLADVTQAPRYFGPLGIPWFQAPQPPVHHPGEIPLNHADLLWRSGYHDAVSLSGLLHAWRSLFDLLQPDLIIAEAAPTATLAARCDGARCVCLDNGFFVPPPGDPLPALRNWEPVPLAELERRETRVRTVIDETLARLGKPELGRFSRLFEVETHWLTWPELNHFGPHSPNLHLGAIQGHISGQRLPWPDGMGRKVFAYLKPDHPHVIPVLEGCLRRGDRVLAYLPRWPVGELKRLAKLGAIHISQAPLDMHALLESCDLVVCHGGFGTVSQTLRAGKPLLLLPSHVEQVRTARAAAALGVAVVPEEERASRRLRIDGEALERARIRAADHAPCLGSAEESLGRLLDILLSAAGRAA
ncbi:glycosyltransferase [Pseudomonas indica]|uniref:glycosyltransferase n=1 Tax=Pseudomonas indica TaxID=137658 RepID=UPI001595373D|nr:nucleotide disphospho-sugar-binding domain-containing protein [Pseudomonas indica]